MEDTAQKLANQYHVDLYGRFPITLTEGKGVHVTATNGKTYLDTLAGIAVNALGYSHPRHVQAIQEQAEKLIHTSNFFYNEPQSNLAKLLAEISGLDQSFFCNSGAEAIEGSIKLARKYGHKKGKTGSIIAMENCFHGRTLGTIAMGKAKYRNGFEPLPGGYDRVPMNKIAALEEKMDDNTIGVILEPIQGEGGINPVQQEYFEAVRKLCDKYDALLILDEIQCGIARTGKMFAYQHYGITPDIVASAKALGGGFPIGAVITKKEVAAAFSHGEHGTTYGGNPLACATACATINTILDENLAEQAAEKGRYFTEKMRKETAGWDSIKEIRGKGLMIGIELNFEGAEVVQEMLKRGVIINCTSDTVLRLLPPLIISKEELDQVIQILTDVIKEVE